MINPVINRYW